MIKDSHEKKISEELNPGNISEAFDPDLIPFLHEDLMDEYDKWF